MAEIPILYNYILARAKEVGHLFRMEWNGFDHPHLQKPNINKKGKKKSSSSNFKMGK